jgi:hypothetical protein
MGISEATFYNWKKKYGGLAVWESFVAGSHEAGHRAATVYSLLATCKLNTINPYYWLNDILENMPRFTTNNIEELLQYSWKKLSEIKGVALWFTLWRLRILPDYFD